MGRLEQFAGPKRFWRDGDAFLRKYLETTTCFQDEDWSLAASPCTRLRPHSLAGLIFVLLLAPSKPLAPVDIRGTFLSWVTERRCREGVEARRDFDGISTAERIEIGLQCARAIDLQSGEASRGEGDVSRPEQGTQGRAQHAISTNKIIFLTPPTREEPKARSWVD